VEHLLGIDWKQFFIPTVPLIEIFIRGTVVYLALFILLRFVLKRVSGAYAVTDLLMIVLIADAAQNAMASDYTSITDGLFLVSTIIFWNYLLNLLGFLFPSIQRFVRPPAIPLYQGGKFLYRNMRHELITEDEIVSQMRKQGIKEMKDVKEIFMEGDGNISIVSHIPKGILAEDIEEK
jgi:uncharacterized membrane protein YcaP (DUF421 family)